MYIELLLYTVGAVPGEGDRRGEEWADRKRGGHFLWEHLQHHLR